MKRRRYYESTDQVEINISPLIDMMFLLLIFFIVTPTFVNETGIEIKRPKAALSEQLEKKSIMIALNADGNLYYSGREININNLRGLIRRLIKKGERPVVVMADSDSRSAKLIEVIDECKAGGAISVNVATEK